MRYYNPWTCRFINIDPLAAKYANLTPYQYAGNRPINFIDIDGAESEGNNPTPQSQQGVKSQSISSTTNSTTEKMKLPNIQQPSNTNDHSGYAAFQKNISQMSKSLNAAMPEKKTTNNISIKIPSAAQQTGTDLKSSVETSLNAKLPIQTASQEPTLMEKMQA